MARLTIQIDGSPDKVMELRPGPHRIGRAPDNDIVLLHASVSSRHCLVELQNEGLLVHDLGSTNGTELDGQLVLEAFAESGQVIGIGAFNCIVEGVVPKVSIPEWEEESLPPLPHGVKPCANHPEFPASMECSHCHRFFCGPCIHLMRRQGGVIHKLCPVCSHHCSPIAGMNQDHTSSSLFRLLHKMMPKTGTMRFFRKRRRQR
jgi:hypothetical protein